MFTNRSTVLPQSGTQPDIKPSIQTDIQPGIHPDIQPDIQSGTQSDTHTFVNFIHSYSDLHGYLAVACCVVGVASCLVNIVVLTRPHMRSALNLILTSLAVMDLCELSSYTVYAAYWHIYTPGRCQSR